MTNTSPIHNHATQSMTNDEFSRITRAIVRKVGHETWQTAAAAHRDGRHAGSAEYFEKMCAMCTQRR